MHSLLSAFFDTLFPLSPHAAAVRDATFTTLEAHYAPFIFQDTTALAPYHTPLIRACIHEAKFQHNKQATTLLGQLLAHHLQNTESKEIHIVPIPLSAERLRERGYNQIVEITSAAQLHDPRIHIHDTLLQKVRHTPSQTSLSREQRLQNLKGVFTTNDQSIPLDIPLILLDDIVTTGATLREAAQTLRDAGFTHVTQLALAH